MVFTNYSVSGILDCATKLGALLSELDIPGVLWYSFRDELSHRFGVELTAALLRQLEQAIKEVCQRSGWGEVRIVVERGKLRYIVDSSGLNIETTE